MAIAAAALVAVTGCSGGVQIAGTVPPALGTIRPDPSGLTETPGDATHPTPEATPVVTPTAPASGSTPAQATPHGTPAGTIVLTNYFLLDSGSGFRLVPVPRSLDRVPAIGGATLRALLAGPTTTERGAGIRSAVPSNALLLGLTIDDGLGTIDLSAEFAAEASETDLEARLAQVVYTLTQFSTVTRVAFRLDGQAVAVPAPDAGTIARPVTRDDYVALLPSVFVESPRWGEAVGSPLRLSGRANVFEATFQTEILDASGKRLLLRTVTASCGTGCWGDFRESLPFQVDHEQAGRLTVYTLSARDGSMEDTRSYGLVLIP